jgi:hypothetical protein
MSCKNKYGREGLRWSKKEYNQLTQHHLRGMPFNMLAVFLQRKGKENIVDCCRNAFDRVCRDATDSGGKRDYLTWLNPEGFEPITKMIRPVKDFIKGQYFKLGKKREDIIKAINIKPALLHEECDKLDTFRKKTKKKKLVEKNNKTKNKNCGMSVGYVTNSDDNIEELMIVFDEPQKLKKISSIKLIFEKEQEK